MKIESFEAPRYSANVNAESRMICDWKYNEVCLELWESNLGKLKTLDLLVHGASGTTPMRIAINNGCKEIVDAANQRRPDLLPIIRHHNPDLESLLDQNPTVEKQEIASCTNQPLDLATRKRI